MTGSRSALPILLALAGGAVVMPAALPAQCRLCATPTTEFAADPTDRIQLDVQARLDFDQLILVDGGSGGSVRLRPDGTSSSSGSIAPLSGRAMVGHVFVRGEPGRPVQVGLPPTILLHGVGGGTIRLSGLATDLPADPRLDQRGELRFRFGGELTVSGDSGGEYRGDVPITVDYL